MNCLDCGHPTANVDPPTCGSCRAAASRAALPVVTLAEVLTDLREVRDDLAAHGRTPAVAARAVSVAVRCSAHPNLEVRRIAAALLRAVDPDGLTELALEGSR